MSNVLFIGMCSFRYSLYCFDLKGLCFLVNCLLWFLTLRLVLIINFCMSLYSSMVSSCFGLGIKDRPFLRRFICVVDIISLSLNMTTSWFCLVIGSDKGSIKDSFISAKDSHNVSMHDLCLFFLYVLLFFLVSFIFLFSGIFLSLVLFL